MRAWKHKRRPQLGLPQEIKPPKFSNEALVCRLGHSHASKLEGSVCQMLQLREKAGEIELLQVQDHVYLTRARIPYIPDFKCRFKKSGEEFWVEAKGYQDQKWPIKKKLWKFYGPGRLEIWTGTHVYPQLTEEIIPVDQCEGIL